MGFDIEKELRAARDSVNSGLIDDKLSGLVGEVRAKGPAGRQALADEDVEMIAAAGSGWQNKTMNEYLEWYQNILKGIAGEIAGAVKSHQDLVNNPAGDTTKNDGIEVQEFI